MANRSVEHILEQLQEFRSLDAPTHGGRVLSYVYDSGLAELDELAAGAARLMQSVNGLDPTTFPSVAALERAVVGFARTLLGGDDDVVGSATSGGTESCLLAVKTARDMVRSQQTRRAQQEEASGGEPEPQGRLRIVAPATVHAAFHKAAEYFDLVLDLVPVDPHTGAVEVRDVIARLGDDVALVVVSAPAYPHGGLDPVEQIATAAAERGVACHVDACFGGLVLPFWEGDVPPWDFRVPGVTSMSADLHKFGYAPKGVSVLLHRGRDRHRAQFFATTRWPGYPVVNPTVLGSRAAAPLAAAWAIIERLGVAGFRELTARSQRATERLRDVIGRIDGLRVVGAPAGPALAIATDDDVPRADRVDPHLWADQVRRLGWVLQQQPGFVQGDGSRIPHTTHLTVTPVTERILGDEGGDGLVGVLSRAADDVRGMPGVDGAALALSLDPEQTLFTAATESDLETFDLRQLLARIGLENAGGHGMPEDMAPLMALIEVLPGPLVEALLTELLAGLVAPTA